MLREFSSRPAPVSCLGPRLGHEQIVRPDLAVEPIHFLHSGSDTRPEVEARTQTLAGPIDAAHQHEYLELLPGERIKYTDRFEDPNLPGEMNTTVCLKPVSVGTEVDIVQEGVPAIIPLEACYLGWQQSLNHLAMLVEPEIKD